MELHPGLKRFKCERCGAIQLVQFLDGAPPRPFSFPCSECHAEGVDAMMKVSEEND